MSKITVFLADDHALFREGLRSLLEDEDDIEIVGEAEDGQEASRLISELEPSVVLMDINMPVVDGVEATNTILRNNPSIRIIILTMHPQDEYVFEALQAGAKAYLLKDTPSRQLLEVIRSVHDGTTMMDPEMTTRLLNEYRRMAVEEQEASRFRRLNDQEIEIVKLLADGASNKEIAETLVLSERTIKNYVSMIYQKIQVNNRTEAAILAMKEGLVSEKKK